MRVVILASCFAAIAGGASCVVGEHGVSDVYVRCDKNPSHPQCGSLDAGVSDTVAPTVQIASPSAGATISGQVTVSGTASDNVSLARIEVRVDAGAAAVATGLQSWTYAVNTTTLSNGSHTITARAVDTAGNATTASVSVTVSNTTTTPTDVSAACSAAVTKLYPAVGGLTAAVNTAKTENAAGRSVCILLATGAKYRESMAFSYATTTAAAIIVEGRGATISGSEVFSDWVDAGGGKYSHVWNYDLGNDTDPWPTLSYDRESLLNREALFIGDTPYAVVGQLSQLTPGRFHVDEVANKVTVYPKPEQVPASAADLTAEITVRKIGVLTQGRRNMILRNFTVERTAGSVREGIFNNENANNLLIENVTIRQGNGTGLGTCCGSGVTYRNIKVIQMGVGTIGTYKMNNVVAEDIFQTQNNWRGAMANPPFLGWSTGSKIMHANGVTIRNWVALNNAHHGFWLDYENQNVTIDGLVSAGNLGRGVYFELSHGPITMTNSKICNNGFSGISFARSDHVTVENSEIFDNRGWQMMTTGQSQPTVLSPSGVTVYGNWITWRNNKISSSHNLAAQDSLNHNWLFNIGHRYSDPAFKATFTAEGNTWEHVRTDAFHLSSTWSVWTNFAGYQTYFAPDGATDKWADTGALSCPAPLPPAVADFAVGF